MVGRSRGSGGSTYLSFSFSTGFLVFGRSINCDGNGGAGSLMDGVLCINTRKRSWEILAARLCDVRKITLNLVLLNI